MSDRARKRRRRCRRLLGTERLESRWALSAAELLPVSTVRFGADLPLAFQATAELVISADTVNARPESKPAAGAAFSLAPNSGKTVEPSLAREHQSVETFATPLTFRAVSPSLSAAAPKTGVRIEPRTLSGSVLRTLPPVAVREGMLNAETGEEGGLVIIGRAPQSLHATESQNAAPRVTQRAFQQLTDEAHADMTENWLSGRLLDEAQASRGQAHGSAARNGLLGSSENNAAAEQDLGRAALPMNNSFELGSRASSATLQLQSEAKGAKAEREAREPVRPEADRQDRWRHAEPRTESERSGSLSSPRARGAERVSPGVDEGQAGRRAGAAASEDAPARAEPAPTQQGRRYGELPEAQSRPRQEGLAVYGQAETEKNSPPGSGDGLVPAVRREGEEGGLIELAATTGPAVRMPTISSAASSSAPRWASGEVRMDTMVGLFQVFEVGVAHDEQPVYVEHVMTYEGDAADEALREPQAQLPPDERPESSEQNDSPSLHTAMVPLVLLAASVFIDRKLRRDADARSESPMH